MIGKLIFCRHLKPGVGYFEQVEVDFEPRCDDGTMVRAETPLVSWYGDLKLATDKAHRPIQYKMTTRETLLQLGFEDVKVQEIQLPLNGWHPDRLKKSLGTDYTAWMGYDDLVGMSLQPFTHVMGMSPERAKDFAREAALDVLRPRLHAYNTM